MPYEDDESWFNAYKEDDSWFDALEFLDKYDKWNELLNTDCVDGVINECTDKCINIDFYIGERHTINY